MSNAAMRQRRTVPLDDDKNDEGDQSMQEEGSLRSSSYHHPMDSRSSPSMSNSKSGRSRRRRSDDSSSSRRRRQQQQPQQQPQDDSSLTSASKRLEPIRQSFKTTRNQHSSHSRGSASSSSVPSISTEELKKKYPRKPPQMNGVHSGMKTPSSRTALTIGSSSVLSCSRSILNSVSIPLGSKESPSVSALPDLFSLEQALNDCDDDQVDRLISNPPTRRQSSTSTPVAWKTPFEVDRPRDTPKIPAPPSSGASVISEIDPLLSEEQDAWAGIDNLLEQSTGSNDDSFVFSMCDILPRDTVKAMRREPSSADSVFGDGDSICDESVMIAERTKRSLAAISKNSSGSSDSRGKNKGIERKHKYKHNADDESSDGPQLDSLRERENHTGEHKRDNSSGGGLFDVFHWSDKANVDDSLQRTKKLNQTKRKVQMVMDTPASNHSASSDDMSLPSLASFRDDELMSRRSTRSSMWDKDVSSVVSDDITEFAGDRSEYKSDSDGSERTRGSGSLGGDGLVLNKQVDDYIKKIQMKLPTISEDGDSSVKLFVASLAEETSPSPTSILEDSPFDKLPSLASLSAERFVKDASTKASSRKVEQKRDPKQSLPFQFMSSIKKMGKVKPTRKANSSLANRDEEKYFPETVNPSKSNKFSANRCLLSEDDDGVNWD